MSSPQRLQIGEAMFGVAGGGGLTRRAASSGGGGPFGGVASTGGGGFSGDGASGVGGGFMAGAASSGGGSLSLHSTAEPAPSFDAQHREGAHATERPASEPPASDTTFLDLEADLKGVWHCHGQGKAEEAQLSFEHLLERFGSKVTDALKESTMDALAPHMDVSLATRKGLVQKAQRMDLLLKFAELYFFGQLSQILSGQSLQGLARHMVEASERIAFAHQLRDHHDHKEAQVSRLLHSAVARLEVSDNATLTYYQHVERCECVMEGILEYVQGIEFADEDEDEKVMALYATELLFDCLVASLERRRLVLSNYPAMARVLDGHDCGPVCCSDWLTRSPCRKVLHALCSRYTKIISSLQRLVTSESVWDHGSSSHDPILLQSLWQLCDKILVCGFQSSRTYPPLEDRAFCDLRADVIKHFWSVEQCDSGPASPTALTLKLAGEHQDVAAELDIMLSATGHAVTRFRARFWLRFDDDHFWHQLMIKYLDDGKLNHKFFEELNALASNPGDMTRLRRAREIFDSRFPQLSWTLHFQKEPHSPDVFHDVHVALGAKDMFECGSVRRRSALAALSAIAAVAAGTSNEPCVVQQLCLGRLHRLCLEIPGRSSGDAHTVSSANECLEKLCGIFSQALSLCQEEDRLDQFFADLAQLISMADESRLNGQQQLWWLIISQDLVEMEEPGDARRSWALVRVMDAWQRLPQYRQPSHIDLNIFFDTLRMEHPAVARAEPLLRRIVYDVDSSRRHIGLAPV